jgi:ABC-2 type transport system ATP-binding protein
VAGGSVQELLASKSGRARYVVEAEGEGVPEALAALPGVSGHRFDLVDGRTKAQLEAAEGEELRPKIFSLAQEKEWTLWELHKERASLEDVFRQLTSEGEEVEA